MEIKYWTVVKEFQGIRLLRDPETFQCRIVPIERPQQEPQTPEPVISPEMERRAAAAYQQYLASKAVTTPAMPAQSTRPLTPEEEWRTRPDIRKEFVSLASYAAYCKAVESGRCRIYDKS